MVIAHLHLLLAFTKRTYGSFKIIGSNFGKVLALPKVKVLTWYVLFGKIVVKHELFKRSMINVNAALCTTCNNELKTFSTSLSHVQSLGIFKCIGLAFRYYVGSTHVKLPFPSLFGRKASLWQGLLRFGTCYFSLLFGLCGFVGTKLFFKVNIFMWVSSKTSF